mgnify:CR=1 FL=1|jgi:hypothetical protein
MVGRNRSAARRVFWLAPLAIGLALLAGCSFESDQLGGFRFDDNYHLRSGERLEGDQVWVGSRLMFDEGSAVNGSITMIGDEVIAGGLVSGDLTVIARDFTLDSAARVDGNLTYCTDRATIREGAQVAGEQREECADKRQGLERFVGAGADRWDPGFVARLAGAVGRAFFLGGIAALGMIVFPSSLLRMSSSVRSAPVASAGIGCLTVIAAIGVSVFYGLSLVLVIPLLLLPVFILGWVALGLALMVGWTAFAQPVGGWLLDRLGMPSQPLMVQAAIGGLALGIAVSIWDLFWFTSWIGTLAAVAVSAIGLGAVILTRLGTRPYPQPA